MATYTSNQAGEYVAPLSSDSGNLFCVYGAISQSSTLTASDIYEMVKVPRGAKIIDVIVGSSNDTSGGTVKVGVDDDDDAFGVDVALDGSKKDLLEQPVELDMSQDRTVILTITATGTAAPGALYCKVFYTLTNAE